MRRSIVVSLFNEAKSVLVGGVNSPVRSFRSVGGDPVFVKSGNGAFFTGEDGSEYLDFVLSWGPLILGHAHPRVVSAISEAASKGTSFGAPSRLETELASLVQDFVPSMKKIRFVSSGTEATMSAIRLARGVTGRSKIIKFEGCYHGHVDSLLVSAGSGGLTLGQPDSAGVLNEFTSQTIVVPYNDTDRVKQVMDHDVAAIILEPVCGNMGLIKPIPGFIESLRELCDSYGSLLIFDEVMTGFRHATGSVQGMIGITPDITCLGKVIGGGLPCGAVGGSDDVMNHLAPMGDVYQAGTLSGNPVVMAAGIATLTELRQTNGIQRATELTELLVRELELIIQYYQLDISVSQSGSMWGLFCRTGMITNLADVKQCNFDFFNQIFHGLLAHGVYIAPSQYEAGFMSVMHTPDSFSRLVDFFKQLGTST